MKVRSKIAKTCLLGALLSTTAMVSTGALAQMATKAPPASTDDGTPWWFHGTVEVGGRDFLNNPNKNGVVAYGQKSLAGYYEYSDIKPGAFGNFDLSAGSKDGVWRVDAGGRNVGYEDQSYYFDWSQAGVQYFNFIWDQSPHVYSMGALTPYVVNGNMVTLVPGATNAANTLANSVPVEIGIHRDTAAASYRWTPENWDFNLDYSHMRRTGTQPSELGEANRDVGGIIAAKGDPNQFPKPVDDTTQNYGAKGEYVGTSPWGKRYVFSLGYEGSQYKDDFGQTLIQATYAGVAPTLYGYLSAWPSNQANGGSATLSADLPLNSRYIGTLNYTKMTQNMAFPLDGAAAQGLGTPYTGPTTSLDGGISTLLFNNTLTTKISDTVTAKTTYRYYDFHNETAELPEQQSAGTSGNVDTYTQNTTYTMHTLSMGYIKSNVGEALNWRPDKYWNIGVNYGFERYDWTRADANVTNDNSAKIYADYKPFSWLTSRASTEFSSRRYENYNYFYYVGVYQWNGPGGGSSAGRVYANSEQQFMFDNRQVWKANYSLDIVTTPNLTLTPWTKYQDANYSVDPNWQQGLQDSKSWNFGIDGTYVVSSDLSFMAGYSRMYATQVMYGSNTTGGSLTVPTYYLPANQNLTNERDVTNTFVAAVKYVAIPDKLDTQLRYTASHGVDDLFFTTSPTFPENKVWFQRLDATAIYKFDPQQVAALGWKGDVKLKLNYALERNSETNWANDPLFPGSTSDGTATLWMGWYNPNYTVHMLSASLNASW